MVIWITGLSGAGKTTIGRELCRLWKERAPHTVLVDGDDVRQILGQADGEHAYTLEARRGVAERIASMCAWLDGQGINVVCCTISAFPDLLARNRRRFHSYFEVFVDAPWPLLEQRARNDLYGRARRGETANVVGIDLPYLPPAAPDLVIRNDADAEVPAVLAAHIFDKARAS
jgi:cytidine diphosphoramidate kinase